MTDSNLDILITRVVDGCSTPTDWDSLEALATTDPTVWRELAQAQRADQLFKNAAAEVVAAADRVELPRHASIDSHAGLRLRARRVAAWGGWAAAAMVTLAFFVRPAGPATSSNQATLNPFPISSTEALKQYLEQGKKEGRVIGEMPDRVVREVSQAEDGQAYEVVFVRQIVERARVADFYQMSHNEAGDKTPVKVRFVVAGGGKSPM